MEVSNLGGFTVYICVCVRGLCGPGPSPRPVSGPACGPGRAGKCERIFSTDRAGIREVYFQTGRAGEREKYFQAGRASKREMSFPMAGPGRATIGQKKKKNHPYLFLYELSYRNETGTNHH